MVLAHRGRVKPVYLQGDLAYRSLPQDIGHWYVRGTAGEMPHFLVFHRSTGKRDHKCYNVLMVSQLFNFKGQQQQVRAPAVQWIKNTAVN